MRTKPNDDLALVDGEPHVPERTCVLSRRKGTKDELIQKKRPEQRRQREPSNRPEDKGGIRAEYGLSDEQGNEIIMAARAHWFEDEGEDAVAETSQ